MLNDAQYRLSRDGRSGKVYQEEDLQTISGDQEPLKKARKFLAKSSAGASQGKADKDHTTVGPENAVVKRHAQNSVKRVLTVARRPMKPTKQEASEFNREDLSTSSSELDDTTETSPSELDDDDVPEKVSATHDQLATRKPKELDDTRASFSKIDDDAMLEEVSAQDDHLIPQQSREEAKTQNLRGVLWRFGLGERPLVDGKKRVRWRCGCGRKCYDDFTELRSGAAAELEKRLNDSMRKHAGSSASSSQQCATLTSAISPNTSSSGYQQIAESDISLQSLGLSANVLPASNMNAAVSIDVNLEKCWLILCGNLKRGPDVLLSQMNLSSTPSDKSLFDDMKSVYSNFRQSWTLRSFLRGVKTIRFVQVGPSI